MEARLDQPADPVDEPSVGVQQRKSASCCEHSSSADTAPAFRIGRLSKNGIHAGPWAAQSDHGAASRRHQEGK